MTIAARRWTGSTSPTSALVAVVLVGLLVIERNLTTTGEWVASHYLFSYQDGLRKRALVGSTLRAVAGDATVTVELVTALGLLQLLVFVLLAGLLTAAVVRRDPEDAPTALLLGMLVVASTHARTLVVDVGRFDVLFLSSLIVVALLALWDARAGLVALPPMVLAGMLVHEISLVATAPLMTLMVLHRLRSLERARTWLLAGAASITLTAGVAVAFLATATQGRDAVQSAMLSASRRADFRPTSDAVWIQSSSTLDNVRRTLWRLVDVGPVPVLVLVVVAVPACVLAYEAALRHDPDRTGRLLGAAALSPLLLMLVAHDYGRWTVLAVLNLLILALWWRSVHRDGHRTTDRTKSELRLPGIDLRRPGMLALVVLALLLPSPSRGGLGFPGVMTSSGSVLRTSGEELLRLLTG